MWQEYNFQSYILKDWTTQHYIHEIIYSQALINLINLILYSCWGSLYKGLHSETHMLQLSSKLKLPKCLIWDKDPEFE